MTHSSNTDLKIAACFTLKNLLFRCTKEVKTNVMKELDSNRLIELLADDNIKI